MSDRNTACIYCSASFDASRGEGDHIVPAGLGEFRNDVRFRRACPNCNNKIGRSEEQLLRCSPEAIFRAYVRPTQRRRGTRSHRPQGSHGMRPPSYYAIIGDHEELVRPSNARPNDVEPVEQMVVRATDGKDHHVPLFPGMRAEQLRKQIDELGIGNFNTAWFHCDVDNVDEYTRLSQQVFPDRKITPLEGTPVGVHSVKGRITTTFDDHYFRAIAKIAFHYYLTHSVRGVRGDEPEFQRIRRFILHGGDPNEFFRNQPSRFTVPFGKLAQGGAILPTVWAHLLAADETQDLVIAYVHLFAGPETVRQPHNLVLGPIPGRLVGLDWVFGHVYLYDKSTSNDGYAGQVEPASISRLK